MKKMEGIKFYLEYEEEENHITLVQKISDYINEHKIYEYEALTIGYWEEAWDNDPEAIIKYLVENKSKFPHLKKIHLGDMEGEECEISWINHTDVSPLVKAFDIEELTITGAGGLRLVDISGDSLKKLTIISGGISKEVLEDIKNAKLPNLEYLELYLGVEDYGFDGSLSDLEPFMKKENFPNLKYLGLKNSEIEDAICSKIMDESIIENLEILDLSLGTLGDTGANEILKNVEKLTNLKKLDLTHHYIADELVKKIENAFAKTNVELLIDKGDAESYMYDDEEWRYPYITE
ncbi:MAG: STM4015 family protein [Marinisporobacter sp.]|nr:STM4015 family protein [Marinisporobacter sp.]